LGDPETDKANAQVETAPVQPLEPIRRGHPKAFWFFFWGEFAERCSFYGMRAILFDFLVRRHGFLEADANTYTSLFIAACYLLPLLGGWIADRFLGKYWTIVGFSLPYIVGQFIVGIENRQILIIALALLAMGSGVIKPNISTLLGLTYEQQRPGQDQLRSAAFSWFYFAINVGALLSQAAVPAIRDRYDNYYLAFLFPAVLMVVALSLFALGKPFYAKEVRSHHEVTPEERAERLKILGRIVGLFVLVMFFWGVFDQTANVWVSFCNTYMDKNLLWMQISGAQTQSFNPFFIITVLPLTTTLFLYLDRRGYKIRPTDKMFTGFLFTVGAMAVMAFAGSIAGEKESRGRLSAAKGTVTFTGGQWKFGATRLEETSKLSAEDGTLTFDTAVIETAEGTLTVSGGEATLGTAEINLDNRNKWSFTDGKFEFVDGRLVTPKGSAEFKGGQVAEKQGEIPHEGKLITLKKKVVELETFDWVRPEGRISVWWVVFAYFLLTLAEIVISPVGLQLAFEAAPRAMAGFVTGCWLACVFLANFAINSWLTRLYPEMSPTAYFLILTVMMAVVSVVFLQVARRFNRPPTEQRPEGAMD
jgi:solute carrier family 15 (oligopeptide transporter), member 1